MTRSALSPSPPCRAVWFCTAGSDPAMRFCMMHTYQRFERDSSLSLYVVKVLHRDLIAIFCNSSPLQSEHAAACAVPSACGLSVAQLQPQPGSLLCMSWASRPAHAAAPAPCRPRLQALGFAPRLSSGTEKKELFEKGRGERGHIHVDVFGSFLRVSERPKTGPAKISASSCGGSF